MITAPSTRRSTGSSSSLDERGLVEITNPDSRGNRAYRLTNEGSRAAREAFDGLEEPIQNYIGETVGFVRNVPFDELVSAIYQGLSRHEEEQRFCIEGNVALIIGIHCSDGVVIGTDSAVTSDPLAPTAFSGISAANRHHRRPRHRCRNWNYWAWSTLCSPHRAALGKQGIAEQVGGRNRQDAVGERPERFQSDRD